MKPYRLRRALGRIGLFLSVLALISPAILVFLWMLSLSLKNEVDNMAFPPVFIPQPLLIPSTVSPKPIFPA